MDYLDNIRNYSFHEGGEREREKENSFSMQFLNLICNADRPK